MKETLIVGATSAIATACARRWAAPDTAFTLVGRDPTKLAAIGDDLVARGATLRGCVSADLRHAATDADFLAKVRACCPRPDRLLVAHGTLPDGSTEPDASTAIESFEINASGQIGLLLALAPALPRGADIAVIGSVAGDRGRPSNYLYGAGKAAVATFCEGWQPVLAARGVHLLLIKPGFVDTPMTAGLRLPGPLVATPERVAADIDHALARRRYVLYTPFFWRPIMMVIRSIPAPIFRRLKL